MPGNLGELVPGALADLIALPYEGNSANVLEAVVENATAVEWMMVQGQRMG